MEFCKALGTIVYYTKILSKIKGNYFANKSNPYILGENSTAITLRLAIIAGKEPGLAIADYALNQICLGCGGSILMSKSKTITFIVNNNRIALGKSIFQ